MEFNKNDFLEAGVQFGHYKNQQHPEMREFIFSMKNRVSIIDLNKIVEYSIKVYEEVRNMASKGELFLFIGRKKQISEIMKNEAIRCKSFFMTKKWPGGFLTNFRTIVKDNIMKLQRWENLEKQENPEKITKKEQTKREKKINKLKDIYEGVIEMNNMRELPRNMKVIIIGLRWEKKVIKEVKKVGLDMIGICDSDTNPRLVDYFIPGNDDGIKSISFFAKLFADAIIEGRNIYEEELKKGLVERENNKETEIKYEKRKKNMAVPFRRKSSSRKKMRNAANNEKGRKIMYSVLNICKKCTNKKVYHQVCDRCSFYR